MPNAQTVTAKSGYSNCKNKPARTYPVLDIEAARKLFSGAHVDFLDRQGTVRRAKITSVKTWKTRVDVEIHLKYGMYEYATLLFTATETPATTLLGPAID